MKEVYPMLEGSERSATAAFVAGVMVGVVAGVLLTPRAGSELRASLKEYAASAIDDIVETALQSGKTYVEEMVQRGKAYIETTVEEVLEPARNLGSTR
jgi:gas vesicle protein